MVPLDIKIVSTRGERHITAIASSVRWRIVLPGGYASASLSLHQPIRYRPDEFELYASVTISYGLEIMWQGAIEDLAASANENGEVWELRPIGNSSITEDKTFPIVYVDRDLSAWERVLPDTELTDGTFSVTDGEHADTGASIATIQLKVADKVAVAGGETVSARYLDLMRSDQNMAVLGFAADAGLNNTDWRMWAQANGLSTGRIYDLPGSTTQTAFLARSVGSAGVSPAPGDFVLGNRTPRLVWSWQGGTTNTETDHNWAEFTHVVVMATLYSAAGIEKVSGYATTEEDTKIRTSTVVADVVGRVLNGKVDGANATIVPGEHLVEQLKYMDGVTAKKIFEDMMLLEPAYYWAIWGTNPDTGKFRFEWNTWSTDVRYELTTADGFQSGGVSDQGLYDRVMVRYVSQFTKRPTSVIRSSTVAALSQAGRHRQGFIDLGDEVSSDADAVQVGDQFLADHSTPLNAGSITVARQILDRYTGKIVNPWELVPGGVVRVLDLSPQPDSLNTPGRDGATKFRCVAVDYDSDSNTATLELDSFTVTQARAVASVRKKLTDRRRR